LLPCLPLSPAPSPSTTPFRSPPAASRPPPTVLLDPGPDPAALRQCLDRLQVTRIDLLVLSHPHADHVGGNDALTGRRLPAQQWVERKSTRLNSSHVSISYAVF